MVVSIRCFEQIQSNSGLTFWDCFPRIIHGMELRAVIVGNFHVQIVTQKRNISDAVLDFCTALLTPASSQKGQGRKPLRFGETGCFV